VQNGEINVHSETTPAYFSIVEPSMVKLGKVIPTWYDPNYNGKEFVPAAVMERTKIPTFPEFYQKVKGSAPSGQLLEAYKTNLLVDSDMLRTVAMPPGVPQAAVDALRKAVAALNDDKDYAEDAMKTIQFIPHYMVNPNLNDEVSKALSITPEMRTFITSYMKKVAK
jgi:putative tricarboxylic transport membrane protein